MRHYILTVSLTIFMTTINSDTLACIFENHDFSALDGVPWEAHSARDPNNPVKFSLSVCQPLAKVQGPTSCGDQSTACSVAKNGTSTNIGNIKDPPDVTPMDSDGVLSLTFNGGPCAEVPGQVYQTVINFKCGKSLGSPIFLDSLACTTTFDWYTSVACKSPPTVKEIKCYTYNKNGLKIDLSPLIKNQGGHKVTDTEDATLGTDFYINVCRDITPAGDTALCSTDSAACRISGGVATNIGQPDAPVVFKDPGQVSIQYTNNVKGDTNIPEHCTAAPVTTVTFSCPTRGRSSKPKLIFKADCHYEVLWVTEYACPEQTLVSKTCKLEKSIHGIDVDLTPLTLDAPKNYHVTGHNSDNTVQYDYYLNVCADIDISCPGTVANLASCQKTGTGTSGVVLGKTDQQTLRYSDGNLVLMYQGGSKCTHNDFKRTTVINFHCDESAGAGSPVFTVEDDCTYVFDWNTQYACVDPVTELTCQVRGGGHLYDLGILTRKPELNQTNWEAINGDSAITDQFTVINVCEGVMRNGLAAVCPPGVMSVCTLLGPGDWINAGVPSNPVYNNDTKSVELHYTGGSPCKGDRTYESIIRFTCKEGDRESPPVLMRKSGDGCVYEFEWSTAAVCLEPAVVGDDCQLNDEERGISFDLRPLTLSDPKNASYNIHGLTGREYYINVCGKVQGSPCNDGTRGEMGACQVDHDGTKVFNTGMWNSKLRYADGFLNLTYTGGDNYNTEPPVPRTTEIAFTCAEGVGAPEYLGETEHVYSILWATKYACPKTVIECVARNNVSQYDLSSLVKSDSNWLSTDDSGGSDKQRSFYINICRNLVVSDKGCDSGAGICEVKFEGGQEKLGHANLGHMTKGPQITGTGELLLEFTGGATCDTNSSRTYTTKIELHCDHGATTTSPLFVSELDCVYMFTWDHAAACPLSSGGAPGANKGCSITDPALDYTYNLSPLTKKDYTVTHSGQEFKLHVCGAVSGPCKRVGENEPAVCLGDVTLGGTSTQLVYAESGLITLTYTNGDLDKVLGENYKTVIEFDCEKDAGEGSPEFDEKDGTVYYFRFATSYVCPPTPIECKTEDDKGHIYDLSRLAKGSSEGNWLVIDTREAHKDLSYYINVCKPVNPTASDNFCTGSVGACQTSSGSSYNLGYLQGEPLVDDNGYILLRYSNGDKCHVGKENESIRHTLITFICSTAEYDPIFVSETDDCEYQFEWNTPVACPVKVNTGTDCKVQEPIFGTTFDLTPLRKDQGYYSVPAGDYVYWLNVCGPLNGVTGVDCTGAASCQTKNSVQQINGGMPNTNITYDDGKLQIVYSHGKDKCHGQYERKTIIVFLCDREVSGLQGPTFLNESSVCEYLFEWRTSRACAAQSEISECSVQDAKGNQYDLSKLRSSSQNYEFMDGGKKVKYLINVCGSVIHGKGAACSPTSAVCLVHMDTTTSYENIGSVVSRTLAVSDSGVDLTYTGGRKCSDGSNSSSVIHFRCQPQAFDTQPQLVTSENNCRFVFDWESSVACPINSAGPAGGNCMVKNPATGYEFNLGSLKDKTWTFTDNSGGHTFEISICGALQSSVCGTNSASCHYETTNKAHKWNSGKPSDKLRFLDGMLQLKYTGGDVCHHHNQHPRSTVINFVCGAPGSGEGKPTYVSEDQNCTYTVYWHTELACENEPMRCMTMKDTATFDLSPLVLGGDGHHSAVSSPGVDSDDSASYYINLCRPLNPIPGATCPPQSAVCKVTQAGAISLGQALSPPKVDSDGTVYAEFTQGGTCVEATGKKWRSKIMFLCDAGLSLGTPTLEAVDLDNCLYVFSWPTNLVCETSTEPDVDNDCTYTDSRTQYTYDFSTLNLNTEESVAKVTSTKGTYVLNICGKISSQAAGCVDSSVCLTAADQTQHSYGKASKITFMSDVYNVKMIYGGGEDCNGSPKKTYILFECDRYAVGSKRSVEIFDEEECSVTFTYKTNLACLPVVQDCILAHAGTTYDLNPLSRNTGSWEASDDKTHIWFNLCQEVHTEGWVNGCPVGSGVCLMDDDYDKAMHILDIDSQTMSMDTKGRIVVGYMSAEKTCGNRGSLEHFSVKIYLKCGNGIGYPQMMSRGTDPCLYEMEWNTTYACAESREHLFPKNDILTDPKTGLDIPVSALTNDKTYTIIKNKHKYIVHLKGTPDQETEQCRGMAVCQMKLAGNDHQAVSLGESSTATYFIEGEVLEAHFTSPTTCETDPSLKATSIITFYCDENNETITPILFYKSKNCQYFFRWWTPGVCPLVKANHADGVGLSAEKGPALSSRTTGIVVGVFLLVLIVGSLVVVLYNPERRARVIGATQRLFRRSGGYESYSYSQLSQADANNTLMNSSHGTYGSDSGRLGNIQAFHDDSDEDILQL